MLDHAVGVLLFAKLYQFTLLLASDEFSPTLDVVTLLFFACEGCDYNLHLN